MFDVIILAIMDSYPEESFRCALCDEPNQSRVPIDLYRINFHGEKFDRVCWKCGKEEFHSPLVEALNAYYSRNVD
jgi:hypothetical protein